MRDLFAKYAVDAPSLDAFLDKYYRHDRYKGRGDDYAAAIRKSAGEMLALHGIVWMGPYESVTGGVVSWMPND
jgi:hypothetical protein